MVSSHDDSSSSDMESDGEHDMLSVPHRHRKRFSIIEISERDFVRKIMSFDTHCDVQPSSWELEFNLSKGAQFVDFTMSITLRRTDAGQNPLRGYAIAFLSNFDDELCPVSYVISGQVPYFESRYADAIREVTEAYWVHDHFRCLFLDGHDTFRYDMLLIKTQLLIRGCCDN